MAKVKRIVVNGGNKCSDSVFALRMEGDRGDAKHTLIRIGTRWAQNYRGSKSVEITSDGNGIDVKLFTDHKGKKAIELRLDYSEAEELGIALLEYTKADPNAPSPLYEVFEKKEDPIVLGRKSK